MPDSDTAPTADESPISGDEGFKALVESAKDEASEERKRLTEAEKQKRKIMRERAAVDESAAPIPASIDGWDFDFAPFPETVRVWIEDTSFEFIGMDERSLQDDPERGQKLLEVKERQAELLEEHSKAATYDAEFWANLFSVEERMELIKQVIEQQDERAGNRQ
jgi:hypothetical protein